VFKEIVAVLLDCRRDNVATDLFDKLLFILPLTNPNDRVNLLLDLGVENVSDPHVAPSHFWV